ncbi:hypothetical protein ACFVKB_45185 [Rhodococcus sp. NPDC127530]|uniref:hypothetical protein n=1 Tax=unclassified Rhodococcus (in: high G+C Gram-positive bacteria) TaxID=192944 RepID=UPI00362D839E
MSAPRATIWSARSRRSGRSDRASSAASDGVGNKYNITVSGTNREVDSLVVEALILWIQHLAPDLVIPSSLPMPGYSWLYELDNRALRVRA